MKTLLLALLAFPLCLRAAEPLPVNLPDGFTAETVAAPPLVQHPIMATLGGPGQLFVGDAAGLNLKKAELEQQLPNRVLLLTDTNGDGTFDKTSVFADKMTFPQGGVFLDGSLYVASPPGIWKLTDTDADGVADQREMIVGGFEYTGNAADVHGPFLHPNGRLYWCHGRKGHDVKQRDGTPVHAGLASGIWSCRPDGADVRWHALGCGDNPVEVDFTPEGEILGTQNIFFSNPRGDTIVHWLRGGVYPREDMLKAIAGLPRTLDAMPAVHNFGHTGVSGLTFYRSGALDPAWRGHLFVVHFNTQRVTRMEVEPSGATYKVAEREFFKLRSPDAHLTDVLEDRDGSLLIVDTGGWFRIGCPSSLMAKPDVAGAIYRVKRSGAPTKVEPWGAATEAVWAAARAGEAASLVKLLEDKDPAVARASANALASLGRSELAPALGKALAHANAGVQLAAAHALGEIQALGKEALETLVGKLHRELDPAVEHQVMHALLQAKQPGPLRAMLTGLGSPMAKRRALMVLDQMLGFSLAAEDVLPLLNAADEALAQKAADLIATHADWVPAAAETFSQVLANGAGAERLALLQRALKVHVAHPAVRTLLTSLVESDDSRQRSTAWKLLAAAAIANPDERWSRALQAALAGAAPNELPDLIDALAKNGGAGGVERLRDFSLDPKEPLALRLKALGASVKPGTALAGESFDLLVKTLRESSAGGARVEAARILAKSKVAPEQLLPVATAFGSAGPLELRDLIKVIRQAKDPKHGQLLAVQLRDAPALGALQESEIRTVFQSFPPDVFEIVAPALRALAAEDESRRRKLDSLPALAQTKGRADEGRKVFESGKAACMACHRIGELGNLVGPNLSGIGQIRTERDLLESIFFPSATLARDYEAQSIDLTGGQTVIGVVRQSLGDSVVIAEPSGQERTLPRAQIVGMQTLPTSLMPAGLDRLLTEQELLDLVAFLRSRKDAPPAIAGTQKPLSP